MSNNVLKLSKQHSQPISSTPNLVPFSNSILQLQHHVSIDYPRERESLANLKDFQVNPANSQAGKKKLAYLLDPSKDLYSSLSPTYASPKSFLGNSITNKLKPSGSSFENSNLNLISPKDLVRLAMSKHKSKPVVKKVPTQTSASLQRNARKSLCVRTGSGEARSQKRDRSNGKMTYSGVEDSMLSKTCQPLYQEKSAKLKRMKLIYNEVTPSEISRLAKSTVYTPNEASGRIRHGTVTPNRSNSGLLWPTSPSGNISLLNASNKKSKLGVGQVGSDKALYGKENEGDKVVEKSGHGKRSSVEHINNFFKEPKPLVKQSKRSDKKAVQPRQMTSLDNIKTSSFSRLMSNSSINQEAIARAKSPTMAFNPEEEEMSDVLEVSEYKAQEVKPREEFITDLKNWVNDIVKPQQETTEVVPKKSTATSEKVKEVQEGMLAKLREVLDNDEFVRREDYERLYIEKESVEEELDSLKEENAQLRALLLKMQEENEARERKEMESRKASGSMNGNCYDSTIIHPLQESLARQNKELEELKRRENIVQDVLKMIWRAGVEIGDLQNPNLNKDNMQMEHNQEDYEQDYSNYTVESGHHIPPSNQEQLNQNYLKTHDKYAKNLKPIGEKIYKEEGEGEDSEAYSRNLIALSDLAESEAGLSNRQIFDTIAKSQNALVNIIKKSGSNPKSTAASSPLFSAKLLPQQNYLPSKTQDKLKIDLTGLGGNSLPKSNAFSSQSSVEKINKQIPTDNVQTLGFHEEFMSKLDEFSQSWRHDALAYQKF